MENTPWQIRARQAGLTQKKLATLARLNEMTVSRQLRGARQGGIPPGYIMAIVTAWELMDPNLREDWIRSMNAAPVPEKPKRPNNLPRRKPKAGKKRRPAIDIFEE